MLYLNDPTLDEIVNVIGFSAAYRFAKKFEGRFLQIPRIDENNLTVKSSMRYAQTILSVISSGGIGISSKVVIASALRESIAATHIDVELSLNQFNLAMKKLGWWKYPIKVLVNDKRETVWLKNGEVLDESNRKALGI